MPDLWQGLIMHSLQLWSGISGIESCRKCLIISCLSTELLYLGAKHQQSCKDSANLIELRLFISAESLRTHWCTYSLSPLSHVHI